MKKILGVFLGLAISGYSTIALAGGVKCASICSKPNSGNFTACCESCADSCPNCLPCSFDQIKTNSFFCDPKHEECGQVCPNTSVTQCKGVPVNNPCETFTIHGGKVDGDCKWDANLGGCNCVFP